MHKLSADIISECRSQFPALERQVNGRPAIFFDGPAGTQVPQCVIDAVGKYLANTNANHGGQFATSRESDAILAEAHRALADFVGTDDPDCIYFGANMTTLTFALSRSVAKTWRAGDELIVTRLDHDANVSPWVRAAQDAGATVRFAEINKDDCTLDLDDFRSKLSGRTKLVAVGCASNSVGSINPVRDICSWAREVGALTFLDAVHYAPHKRIDVQKFGCDFLAASAYKFFGPHVGFMWGRRDLLEKFEAYKVRPAANDLPAKWMSGTQCHEGIAGSLAAVNYLAEIGKKTADNDSLSRRDSLTKTFQAISEYEGMLVGKLLKGLSGLKNVNVFGITEPQRLSERLPTVSIRHDKLSPVELAGYLGDHGVFVWHGNYYALELSETLGLEPEGMVRIGLVHYNTEDEVDRLLELLSAVD